MGFRPPLLLILSLILHHASAIAPAFFLSQSFRNNVLPKVPAGLINTNALHRLTLKQQAVLTTRLHLVDFLWDFLEPFENAWEFYVHRDDILEEWISRSATFAKTKTVRFGVYTIGSILALDLIARVGIIGDRGKGIWATLRDSDEVHGTFEEKFFQKITRESADIILHGLRNFRRFGGKSKFAVAFSAGALFYETAVHATSAVVKLTIGSFVILEAASFAGIIGDTGESILDWIEDHRADTQSLNKKLKKVKVFIRAHLSMEKLEDFYEVAVDEEKVACAGFAMGSLFAIFTW